MGVGIGMDGWLAYWKNNVVCNDENDRNNGENEPYTIHAAVLSMASII